MKSLMTAVISVFFLCGAVPAEEQSQSMRLEEAVVTATRTERPTEEIPAGVSTVTKEDIKDTRMFNLKEAMSGVSGVQSESRNGGYDSRLIIRGAGLKARYGIREVMILLDGVPITDPDGLSRLDFVDTQLVEQIDIVKGPNSTLYGANAAGGIVNIITRSPYEETAGVKAGYGSDNTQMYNALYGNRFGDAYVSLSGSRRSTDSWRKWNEFSTDQGSLKIGHVFDDKTSVDATVNYSRADIQLPGTLTRQQYESDITQLTSEPWRHSGRYSHALFTSVRFRKETGAVDFKPMLYYQKWDHYHPVTGLINDGGANIYGADVQVDVKHGLAGSTAVLTAGVSGQMDDADADKYTYRDYAVSGTGRILYTLSDAKGNLAENDHDTTTKWGVYVQESVRPSDRWIVDLGVRYDTVGFDIQDRKYWEYNYGTGQYQSVSATVDQDASFRQVSPRLGVVYKLTSVFNLYGNVSTGFQTPQASEISVNPALIPSTTMNYEAGVKARTAGGHSLDLSAFSATVKDEIVQTIEAGNISSYSNAGETAKKGVELSGEAQAAPGLFLGASYTYSGFHFRKFIEPVRVGPGYVYYDRSGNSLPYIPRHQYTLYALYRHPSGFRAKVDTNTWGEYYADNANSGTYEGYRLITNALVGFEKGRWDASVDANNVFDKKYAMEVTKDTSGALRYRPGGPVTYMARVSYRF